MSRLSEDLRKRVVDTYEAGDGSMRELAERFAVSLNFVQKWIHRARQTGSVASLPFGGGPPRAIDEDGERLLVAWVTEQPDLTLQELADRYQQHRGRSVGVTTIFRTLERLGMTRKKNSSRQ